VSEITVIVSNYFKLQKKTYRPLLRCMIVHAARVAAGSLLQGRSTVRL